MENIVGWYYLHTESNDLIYKRKLEDTFIELQESSFTKMIWPIDPHNRIYAYRMLIESMALGANKERTSELALAWNCDDKDAKIYATIMGLDIRKEDNEFLVTCIKKQDVEGRGKTILEAMANLCQNLGFEPSKSGGISFEKLVAF